ncbi:MAG TPA: AAA family ATPase [Spirochaetota bacterium]|nr:AAA family ATPase [Spirochaetota bacterium]HPJ35643.1 AAA family ATPase [Spirochaetota bacterium]
MQHIERIEDELKKIRRWHLVPGKKNILRALEHAVKKNESIVNVVEGFFTSEDGNAGPEEQISGVFIITSEKGIFIRSDDPSEYMTIDSDELQKISFSKGFSGLRLNIVSDDRRYCFFTHASEGEIKNILGGGSALPGTFAGPAAPPASQSEAPSRPAPPVIPSPSGAEPVAAEKKTGEAEAEAAEEEEPETIEEVMEAINKLVGMKKVKDEINSYINFIKIRKERETRGLPVTPLSLHAVFYGPPGTGKTTIARLVGRVYKALGLLAKGHLIETDRAGLVAGYVGQTAVKTDEMVTSAIDGVLFIDEAYSLIPETGGNDFGREAVDTILKRMEDLRNRFAVIVGGYPDEMERFINANPGLKSRFSRYFYFDHYNPDELMAIFNIFSGDVKFVLEDDAVKKTEELFRHFYDRRDRSFGNGRFARNVFEKIVQNQADRLSSLDELSDELLCGITSGDIPEVADFSDEEFA